MPRVSMARGGRGACIATMGALVAFSVLVVAACETAPKPLPVEPAPAGPGYDDLRGLSRDDCAALRDHQIEIAVNDALAASDAGLFPDAAEKLSLEASLRMRQKEATDAWIGRCTGKVVRARDLRCMRWATSTQAFVACGALEDEGSSDGGAIGEAAAP